MPYIGAIWSIWKKPSDTPGKVEPSKASWLIWATLDTITLVGMFAAHSVNGQILGAVSGAWIVAILAILYGKPGWSRLDKLCLVGAVIGIVLMFVKPEYGIVASLTVFIGSFPTFKSAWTDPSKENKLAWTIFWLSCVSAMFAIPKWTIADVAQPTTFTVIEMIMMFLLFRPRTSK